MKSPEILEKNKINESNESNDNEIIIDVQRGSEIVECDDGYFEKLFYSVIDVFAYSKFYDITINPSEKSNIAYVNFVKNLHSNFKENKECIEVLIGKQLYENLRLIIDEFCVEKFKKFINIKAWVKDRDEADEKISEFLNVNNQSIEFIKNESEKNINHQSLEIIIKSLQNQNPQRFKNLIDFEINRIELKNINDDIRFMAGDRSVKPSAMFLEEVKECTKLQGKGLNKNKFSCVIS